MATSNTMIFGFFDLPITIWNRIYCDFMCRVKPRRITINLTENFVYNVARAHNGINAAILYISKSVWREVYDVLVKINRFFIAISSYGMPLRSMIVSFQVQVVASQKGAVDSFMERVFVMGFAVKLNLQRAD